MHEQTLVWWSDPGTDVDVGEDIVNDVAKRIKSLPQELGYVLMPAAAGGRSQSAKYYKCFVHMSYHIYT